MKKINTEQQFQIVETFLIHCTSEKDIKKINYKLTSDGWAKLISKWSGVEISPETVNEVFINEYSIENVKICEGVYCFAEEIQ
jgi:hypothetical protein